MGPGVRARGAASASRRRAGGRARWSYGGAHPAGGAARGGDGAAAAVCPPEPPDRDGARYPDYAIAGIISLIAGAGFGVGAGVAAATGNPKTGLGLAGLGTASVGVGLPLLLLGAADVQPVDEHLMAAGIVTATPGALAAGIGGAILAFDAARTTTWTGPRRPSSWAAAALPW